MVRKITVLIALLAITLTACGSSARPQSGSSATASLNPMSQLAIGTLKLDGTKSAVTKEQATQLIPLWQVYKQLSSSDTAAPQEIDGLSAQIRDTLTTDQRKAISGMKLSQSDMLAYVQQGAGSGGQAGKSGSGSTGAGGFAGGDPGGMPPAGMMGDPGGMPPGMTGGSSARQSSGTQTANSSQAGAQNARLPSTTRVPPPLIEALIQYLQKVAAS